MTIRHRSVESVEQVPLGAGETYRVGEQGLMEIVEYICDICNLAVLHFRVGLNGKVVCEPCMVDTLLWAHQFLRSTAPDDWSLNGDQSV